VESIQRMGLYAKYTGARIHIFHLSSREGLDMIDEWRAKGVDITTETGAHYVFKKAEDMDQTGVRLRMNPPVRWGSEGHGDYLLQGLRDGRVNQIATDHSPHTQEEKLTGDIWTAISGFPGVETSVAYFLTYGVNAGRMTLQEFVRATSEGPAKTWDMYPQKGAIAIGSDGDLTIVDLNKEGVVRDDELHSKNHVTPFDGDKLKGMPVGTIVRGQVIFRDGQIVGSPAGRMIRPNKSGERGGQGVRELVGAGSAG
jgi:allantoinase